MGFSFFKSLRGLFVRPRPATAASVTALSQQLSNVSINPSAVQRAIRASNVEDVLTNGARVVQDQADIPESAARAIADSGVGRQVDAADIRAVNQAAESTGDVATKAEQTSMAQKILKGTPLTASDKKLFVKLAVTGGVMLLAVGGLLTWLLIEYNGMDKARFTITSVSNEKELDEVTASLLEYYESGGDLDEFDPDDIEKPKKNWHILRVEYEYPDEDFRIAHGHEIETEGTDTSPSIDQTRYVVMSSGEGYVNIAAPFKLSSTAGEGGSLTIHYNMDYQLAALAQNIEASADEEVGPDDSGDSDDEDGDGDGDDDDDEAFNPFKDIDWGWLIVGGIVLVLAMLLISMVSRSRGAA